MNRCFAALAVVPQMAAGQAALAAAADGHQAPSLFAGDLAMSLWTLLIFFLVVFVLGRFAWKPLLAVLQRREEFIRESLESAKRDREAAEARLLEYEQRLQKAREEASALVEEGRRDAEMVKRRIEEEARKSGEAMIERAKREIGIARDTALKQLYEESAQLATTLAGSMLQRQLTVDDHGRMVQEALGELHRTPGNEN
jgi:F-type H+-transporting ATPase subunit b